MFTINAYHNPYLRRDQSTHQAVLSIRVDPSLNVAPAPLALAIALDRSGSMDGAKLRAARDGAMKVVEALEPEMTFLIVTFNNTAQSFGPHLATRENKRRALDTLHQVYASGGTCMSTALNQIIDRLGKDQTRALKILFLTDGRNETESRQAQASISAWGIGTDWDETELRHLADATHGSADIIPTPQQIETAFAAAFKEMRGTSITHTRMSLWSPAGVKIKRFEQVYPNIVALGPEPDAANPRQQVVSLGSFAAGDQRDYLLELEVPVYAPGQQFLLVRPNLKYVVGGVNEMEEKSTRAGWVFAQWTEDRNLASQIEEHIGHYTHQEELARAIREGQAALAAGDNEKATRLLAHALDISERTGNEKITRRLRDLVQRDSKGTIRLNPQANAVARKTLAINTGRTSKLK